MHIKEIERSKVYEETLNAIRKEFNYHSYFNITFVLFSSTPHVIFVESVLISVITLYKAKIKSLYFCADMNEEIHFLLAPPVLFNEVFYFLLSWYQNLFKCDVSYVANTIGLISSQCLLYSKCILSAVWILKLKRRDLGK